MTDSTGDDAERRTGEYPTGPYPGDQHWGYGLAAWILASYTDPAGVVLDLDGDPDILACAQTMNRACIVYPQPGAARTLHGTAHLVTAHWPRHTPAEATPTDHDTELLAEAADVLDPGGRLALVLRVPAPTEPLTIHTGPLLTAVLDAGRGQLVAVHAVAIAPRRAERTDGLGPDYRCALVFRRPGRGAHRHEGPESSGVEH